MSQDNVEIIAAHLGILEVGGTLMFLDITLPEAVITYLLERIEPMWGVMVRREPDRG